MIGTVISGIISFIGTNIDDILIGTIFFTEADTKQKIRGAVLGKYLGIGTLVLFSVLGAFGLSFLPQEYIRFLGLIPIGLGIREWISHINATDSDDDDAPTEKSSGFVLNVTLITLANGADNIGVYIPLFAGFDARQLVTVICVFAVMTGLWCVLSKRLSDLPVLRSILTKYRHAIIPAVYIVLGVYILFF